MVKRAMTKTGVTHLAHNETDGNGTASGSTRFIANHLHEQVFQREAFGHDTHQPSAVVHECRNQIRDGILPANPHGQRIAIDADNGAIADVQFSTLAAATKPRWFILGTDGAIVSEQNHFRVTFFVHGYRAETTVPYRQSAWHEFYRNVVNHLLHGEELVIKPEQARRVIAIMEYAERSARQGGKALALPYET